MTRQMMTRQMMTRHPRFLPLDHDDMSCGFGDVF
jgi:hypothetical protein